MGGKATRERETRPCFTFRSEVFERRSGVYLKGLLRLPHMHYLFDPVRHRGKKNREASCALTKELSFNGIAYSPGVKADAGSRRLIHERVRLPRTQVSVP